MNALPATRNWYCSGGAICHILCQAGFRRYVTPRRPWITETTSQKQLVCC